MQMTPSVRPCRVIGQIDAELDAWLHVQKYPARGPRSRTRIGLPPQAARPIMPCSIGTAGERIVIAVLGGQRAAGRAVAQVDRDILVAEVDDQPLHHRLGDAGTSWLAAMTGGQPVDHGHLARMAAVGQRLQPLLAPPVDQLVDQQGDDKIERDLERRLPGQAP